MKLMQTTAEDCADFELDTDSFSQAIDAAQEANRAGDDDQKQLEIAIKVYLRSEGLM